jgi:hypothetical protein
MASYLRPRRGKKSTANSKNIVLKKGEVFFEAPDTGVGTGVGRIKVGDGSTAYSSLPAFMDLSAITYDVANSTIAFTATSETNNTTLLNKIVTGAKLNVIIAAVKNLLSNLSSSVTTLNNDLDKKASSSHTHTFASLTSKPTTLSGYGITDAVKSSTFNAYFADNPSVCFADEWIEAGKTQVSEFNGKIYSGICIASIRENYHVFVAVQTSAGLQNIIDVSKSSTVTTYFKIWINSGGQIGISNLTSSSGLSLLWIYKPVTS